MAAREEYYQSACSSDRWTYELDPAAAELESADSETCKHILDHINHEVVGEDRQTEIGAAMRDILSPRAPVGCASCGIVGRAAEGFRTVSVDDDGL